MRSILPPNFALQVVNMSPISNRRQDAIPPYMNFLCNALLHAAEEF